MLDRSMTGAILASMLLSVGLVAARTACAGDAVQAQAASGIHVDIAGDLKQADVVFNMDHPANGMGDTPIGIDYMHLLAARYERDGIRGRIVGIFHGDGGYLLLNDKAFDAFTNSNTGNPYKEAIAGLLKQGVEIEQCAVTMKAHNWGNANLLPGVKVDDGAVARVIELVQDGFVQLHY